MGRCNIDKGGKVRRRAFIFPGQGAQYPGMGKDFYDAHSVAKEVFQQADDLLKENLSKVIFEGPADKLMETCNSQVAIFVTSYAIFKTVQALFPRLKAEVCSGLSLGEYTAIVAGGILPFEEALLLVRDRGRFMHESCLEKKGEMAVILGMSGDQVDGVVSELNMNGSLWVANYNCPGQVVISGTKEGIEKATKALLESGAKRVMPLQVAGAFHSGLMKGAAEKLKGSIAHVTFKKGLTDIVMNVPGDYVEDVDAIAGLLAEQVTRSVKWEQGVRNMERRGINCFIEMGCGKVLSGLNRKIGVLGETLSIENLSDLEKAAPILEGE